jgi:hypothetical protein
VNQENTEEIEIEGTSKREENQLTTAEKEASENSETKTSQKENLKATEPNNRPVAREVSSVVGG